jgi:hypothetical protein
MMALECVVSPTVMVDVTFTIGGVVWVINW